jgi:hypothetical protein
MKLYGLIKLAAGALLFHTFSAVKDIGTYAFPVTNEAQINHVNLDLQCQGTSHSGNYQSIEAR